MASTCPHCGKKLHFWDVKAECTNCGVSIPNYNWQARLEEDNIRAEQKFATFYKSMNMIKYSIFGTKLRIARLVLTFLPAIGFILPWATLKSSGASFELTIISLFGGRKGLIDFFGAFFGDTGLFFTNMGFEKYSGALTFCVFSYLMFVLSVLFIVIAFFMNIIMCKKPKTKVTVVFDILSVITSIISVVLFVMAGPLASQAVAFNFGGMPVIDASASVSWGYFIALALLLVATGVNIAVAKAPAKTDEELEAERLARVAKKEEAERQKEIEREKSREAAAKAAEEEQRQKVEQAKAKLAAKAEKKNK